jgi:hypothetical protein
MDQVEIEEPWVAMHWRAIELGYYRVSYFLWLASRVADWHERRGAAMKNLAP